MSSLPPTLNKVIESFSKFPGIGKKTAHRLGLYVLKTHKKEIEDLAQALINVKNKISTCESCYNISEMKLCKICSDEKRDKSVILSKDSLVRKKRLNLRPADRVEPEPT